MGNARRPWGLIVVLIITGLALAQVRALGDPVRYWSLQGLPSGNLALTLGMYAPNHTWEWEDAIALSQLSGLDKKALQAKGSDVHFVLHRPAGAFVCVGHAAGGAGRGTFTFVPDSAFAQSLAARGIARPTPSEQLELAVADITPALVDQLRQGLTSLSIDDIVQVADRGITPAYVAAIRGLGYQPTAEQLVRLADHGVTPAWIRQVQAAGLKPTLEDLVRMRDAGV